MQIGYKVVELTNKKMMSYMGENYLGIATVEYSINKESKRNKGCGPLAIFKTLEDAKEFMAGNANFHIIILKVKYNQSDMNGKSLTPSNENAVWVTKTHGFRWDKLPDNTILVNKLISTEIVLDNKNRKVHKKWQKQLKP